MTKSPTTKPRCECCGEREADDEIRCIAGYAEEKDVIGAPFAFACWSYFYANHPGNNRESMAAFCEKIRTRRATLAQPKCKSQHKGETCCKTGEHLVHYPAEDQNCTGWMDYVSPSGSRIELAILSNDEASYIEELGRRAIESGGRARVYGTQPDKLPATLPAGTKSVSTGGRVYTAEDELRIRDSSYGAEYSGAWNDVFVVAIGAGLIDWSSVLVQEEPQAVDLRITSDGAVAFEESDAALRTRVVARLRESAAINPVLVCSGKVEPSHCLECSGPIFRNNKCRYCYMREMSDVGVRESTDGIFGNQQARARMDLADRKARPRETASSRALALPHPWESDEGEP